MFCIPADVFSELCLIDDELKAIYHSSDSACIWVFPTPALRDEFVRASAAMSKLQREAFYHGLNK